MPENNQRINSRRNQNHRKKKSNTLVNVLIGIVLFLIIVTVVNIVTDEEVKENTVEQDTSPTTDKQNNSTEKSESTEEDTSSKEQTNAPTEEDMDSSEEDDANEETAKSNTEVITTEPSSDSNIESEIVDSSWEPIGTIQTGEHVSSYDKNSVDWSEKVKALAYASNLDASNMYVRFLGNGGSPQKSIGTVTSKDGSEIYRISLEWIDGKGWKPTKKEILKSLE